MIYFEISAFNVHANVNYDLVKRKEIEKKNKNTPTHDE